VQVKVQPPELKGMMDKKLSGKGPMLQLTAPPAAGLPTRKAEGGVSLTTCKMALFPEGGDWGRASAT
jgi:hypothetical protein